MHVICPHCQSPLEVDRDTAREEVVCSTCGSSFKLREGSTSAATLPEGQRKLGRFEILQTVGVGAHGTVYRARDPKLDRVIAIKVPRAGVLAEGPDIDRFLREGRSVARLRHAGIVPVHEVGKWNGLPYLVSDFVEGITLSDQLAVRRLSARKAARLVAAVADALQYAHDHGVVHRDVKPSNIMLGAKSQPYLMDFGLARRDAGDPTMTTEGQVLGTPAYMSPEQARGEAHRVDGRSDVYSLGVILYELLTGQVPFRGNARMVLHQVLHDEPRLPRSLNAKIPRDLETICVKAMAKTADRRYASARDLADDLRNFLKGEPIRARPPGVWERGRRWVRRHRTRVAVAVIILAALGALTALKVWHRETLADVANQRLMADQAQQESHAHAYASRANLIQMAWKDQKVRRAQELLDLQHPANGDADLRGFEWYYFQRLVQGSRLTLSGHTDTVTAVAFSSDRQRLASAGLDRSVKVWELATGLELRTLTGHASGVIGVVFGRNGQRLATIGQEGEIKVWDAATGRELCTVTGQAGEGGSLALSPDGRRLAAAHGQTVKVCDAASGKEEFCFTGHGDKVTALAWSVDGSQVASASEDGAVKLWEAADGKEIQALTGVANPVRRLGFLPKGRQVRLSCRDGSMAVWDSAATPGLSQLAGPDTDSKVAALSQNGERLARLAPPQTVRVWDLKGAGELFALRGHTSPITSVVFSDDDTRIATASQDRTVRVWTATFSWEGMSLHGHRGHVNGVAFSPDDRLLASAGADGTVRLRETATGQEALILQAHDRRAQHRAASPERALHVEAGATCVVFDPAGKRLATAGADGMIRVWDVDTGRPLLEWSAHARGVAGLAFRPDGRHLASASWDRTVRVWDADTGKPVHACRGHQREAVGVAFSPDGKLLASGGWDYVVRLWDAETGAEVRSCLGHQRIVESVAFSPDGRHVAGASNAFDLPGEVKVWETTTGKEVMSLKGHVYGIYQIAYSRDGRRLATAACEGAAKLWDTATGQELLTFHPGPQAFHAIALSRDGRRLALGCRDSNVVVLDSALTTTEERIQQSASRLVEKLFDRLVVKSEVVEHLRGDPWLSEPLRQEAVSRAERYLPDAERFNDASWTVVGKPGADPAAYGRALRQAQEASRLRPGDGAILNTLGVAQYRVRDYQAAVDTLTRADQIHTARYKESLPADVGFLAMAYHALGRVDQARNCLERLRQAMRQPAWAKDPQAQACLREAESVVNGNAP